MSETPLKIRLSRAVEKMHLGQQLEPSEIKDLRKYLGSGRVAMSNDVLHKIWTAFRDTVGLSRAVMTSWDLSAAGRQGLFASVMNPKLAAEAMRDQLKAFMGTELQFKEYMAKMESPVHNPYLELQKEAGLHFSHQYKPGGEDMAEEMFQYSSLAEKLPLVRRSERAYIAYLNKLRVGLFNKMADKMLASVADGGLGMDLVENIQDFKDLAYMVNTLTGRGELSVGHISPASFLGKKMDLYHSFTPGKGTLDSAHQLLTAGLFAPRFMASRYAMLRDASIGLMGLARDVPRAVANMDPRMIGETGMLSPTVYKEYMRNAMGTTMTIATVMSSLAALGLGSLTWDPKKSDFGVLKIGKARYDPWGGMKPWVKLFAMLGTDEYFSSTGTLHKWGEYGGRSKKDLITQFMLTKGSPATSLILEGITGENVVGEQRSLFKAAAERFTPMMLQDMYEIYEEESAEQAALSLPFVIVGGGVQAYDPFAPKKR